MIPPFSTHGYRTNMRGHSQIFKRDRNRQAIDIAKLSALSKLPV